MARKFNVELILTAKQNASKAVTEVTKQLDNLKKSQQEVSKEAAATAASLSTLGKSLDAGKAVDSSNKLRASLSASLAELNKARQSVKDLKAVNVEFTASQIEAKSATDASTKALQNAATKIKELALKEKEATKAAKAATAERARQVKIIDAFTKKRDASLQKQVALGKRIADAEKKADDARARRTGKTKELTAKLNALIKKRDEEKKKLDDLTASYEKSRAVRKQLTTEIIRQNGIASRADASITKQKANLGELDSAKKDAVATERELSREARASANALKRQESELSRLRQTARETIIDIRAVAEAEKELAIAGRKITLPIKAEQKQLLKEARLELEKMTGAVAAFVAKNGEISKSSEQFKELTDAARRAKQNLIAQRDALVGISAAVRKPISDLSDLKTTISGVNAALSKSKGSFSEYRKAAVDIEAVNASFNGLKGSIAEASLTNQNKDALLPIRKDAKRRLLEAKLGVDEYTASLKALAVQNKGNAAASPLFAGLREAAAQAKQVFRDQQVAVTALDASIRKPIADVKELKASLKAAGEAARTAEASFTALGQNNPLRNIRAGGVQLANGLIPGLRTAVTKDVALLDSIRKKLAELRSAQEATAQPELTGAYDGLTKAEQANLETTKQLEARIRVLAAEELALADKTNKAKVALSAVTGIKRTLRAETGRTADSMGRLVAEFDKLNNVVANSNNGDTLFAQEIADAKSLESELRRVLTAEQQSGDAAELNSQKFQAAIQKQIVQVERLQRTLTGLSAKGDGATGIELAAIGNRANRAAAQLQAVSTEFNDLYNKGKLLESLTPFDRADASINRLTADVEKSNKALDKLERKTNRAIQKKGDGGIDPRRVELLNQKFEKQNVIQRNILDTQNKIKASQKSINTVVSAEKDGRLSAADAASQLAAEVEKIDRAETRLKDKLSNISASYDARFKATAKLVNQEIKVEEALRRVKDRVLEIKAAGENALTGNTVKEIQELTRLEAELKQLGGELDKVKQKKTDVDAAFNKSIALNLPFGQLRKTAASTKELATESNKVSSAFKRLTGATQQYSAALDRATTAQRKLAGGTRSALGFTQRLRGQVISTIAAYAGFFEVIQQIKEVGKATQELQSINSTLLAVTGGDQLAANSEFDFVQQQAERLGLEVKSLAKNYADFAIAAKASGKVGAGAAREIFVNFVEIGRALHLPPEQIDRITLALQQMLSKGTIQMEELKKQLGDALPGAVSLLAKSLGKSTEEMFVMIQAGQVGAEALLKFSRVANQDLAAGLPEALKGIQASFGRMANAVFNARVEIAEGGLEESLKGLADSFTAFLKSTEGRQALEDIGGAMGVLVDGLKLLLGNLDLLKTAIGGFVGLKFVQLFTVLNARIIALAPTIKTFIAGITSAGGVVAALRAGLIGLATAAAVNPLGVLAVGVVAITAGLAFFGEETKSTNILLREHTDIVRSIRSAYQQAEEGPNRLARALDKLSLAKLTLSLQELTSRLPETTNRFKKFADSVEASSNFSDKSNEFKKNLAAVAREIETGVITNLEDANTAIDDAVKTTGELTDANRELLANILPEIEAHFKVKQAIEETQAAIDVKNGKIEDGQGKTLGVRDAFKDVKTEVAGTTKESQNFEEVMGRVNATVNKIKGTVKGVADVMSAMASGSSQQIVDNFNSLSTASASFASSTLKGRDGLEAGINLIIKREGFLRKARLDVTKGKESQAVARGGYGSDTRTDANGRVSKVRVGDIITRLDAIRDLQRRARSEFIPQIVKQIGQDRFDSLSKQQQGVLISNVYNYGSLTDKLAGALKTGDNAAATAALRGQASHNQGQNAGRRIEEAVLFAGASSNNGTETAKRLATERIKASDDAKKRIETEKEFQAQLDQRLEKANLLNKLKGASSSDRAAAIAVFDAENAARERGVELTAAQKKQIEETARLQEKARRSKTGDNTQVKEAAAAQKRLNDLIKQREELLKQIKLQEGAGDTAGADATKQKVVELSTEIAKARQEATALNAALAANGDASAGLANAKNNTAQLAYNLQQGAISSDFLGVSMSTINETFASGLTSAFDNFANAVANGENAADAARKAFLQFASDFLRQIAQMIIKQALMNALQGATGGGGGGIGGLIGGLFGAGHHGGRVNASGRIGSGNQTRNVSPSVFAGAQKFHEGGVVGLRPGEVPAILKVGEQVLPANNPNNILNAAAQQAKQSSNSVKVINTIDAGDFVGEGLASSTGEDVFMNFITTNSTAVKAALE